MQMQTLEIKAAIQISKPSHDVFEAIVDPAGMKNYFISTSSGKMEEGKEIKWQFPEFDEYFPVKVSKIIKDEYISFYWETAGRELLVEITLSKKENDSTKVTVTEK